MIINRVRVDLLDVYTTIDPLRGLARNPNAPFSFLTAKGPYNRTYGEVVQNPLPIPVPPLELCVRPICREGKNQNFWNGARNRRYDGYVGSRPFREVAWNKFLPFVVEIPVTLTPTDSNDGTTWTGVTPRVYGWSCGWGVDLRLTAEGALSLEGLATLIRSIHTRTCLFQIGHEAAEGPIPTILMVIAQWIQRHIFQPIVSSLSSPMLPADRYGPVVLITAQMGSKDPQGVEHLDERSQRLIYAVTSQNPAWEAYNLDKIREGFKTIDTYPGSFIFMDRMARFFWFPHLMTTKNRLDVKLDCYIENTKSAMCMMIRLVEFIRLLIQRQGGPTLRANYPVRDLFERALANLEQFPSFYRNTNLKRMASDLEVPRRLQEGRSLVR